MLKYKVLLLIFCLLAERVHTQYSNKISPYFGAYQHALWYQQTNAKNTGVDNFPITTPKDFTIAAYAYAVMLNGFSLQQGKIFDFDLTIVQDSSTSFTITLQTYGNIKFKSLSVSVIIMTSGLNNYMQINTFSQTCGTGCSTTRNPSNIGNFVNEPGRYQCIPVFAGIKKKSGSSNSFDSIITIQCSLDLATNQYTTIITQGLQPQTQYSKVSYVVILFERYEITASIAPPPNYYIQNTIHTKETLQDTCTVGHGLTYDQYCVFGFKKLISNYYSPKGSYFYANFTGSVLSELRDDSGMEVLVRVFCLYLCQQNAFYNYTTDECQNLNCTQFHNVNCIQCTFYNCTECLTGYHLDTLNGSLCTLCNISVTGCLECYGQNNCSSCVQGFLFQNQTSCQNCSEFMVGCEECTNQTNCSLCSGNLYSVIGGCIDDEFCLEVENIYENNTVQCLKCNLNYCIFTDFLCTSCGSAMPLCENCTDCDYCDGCISGSFIEEDNKTCTLCNISIVNCATCNISQCHTCSQGFLVENGCTLDENCKSVVNHLGNYSTTCTSCKTNQYVVSEGWCRYCQELITNCIECTSVDTCTKCGLGSPVIGGCSSLPGCIEIQDPTTPQFCKICDSTSFFLNSISLQCECRVGHLTKNGLCSNIPGCLVNKISSGLEFCLDCDETSNFIKESGKCPCITDQYVVQGQTCIALCGNAFKIDQEDCDDGNLANGDGCDSKCEIQKDYYCEVKEDRSICRYNGSLLMTLQSITKKITKDIAIVTIEVSPKLAIFDYIDLRQFLNYESEADSDISQISYSNGIITLQIEYSQDLEGAETNLTLVFASQNLVFASYLLSFKMDSAENNLFLKKNQQLKKILEYILLGTMVFAVLIFAVGNFFHKMVGVETLNTFQLIYYLQFFGRKDAVTRFLALLNPSTSQNPYLYETVSLTYYIEQSSFSFDGKFLERFTLAGIILLTVGGVFSFIAVVYKNKLRKVRMKEKQYRDCSRQQRFLLMEQNQGKKIEQQLKEVKEYERRYQMVYNRFVFPLSMGFFYNFCFSLIVCFRNSSSKYFHINQQLGGIIMMALYLIVFVTLFSEFKFLFFKSKDSASGFTQSYVSVYILVNFFIMFLFVCDHFQFLSALELILGTLVLSFVLLVCFKSYKRRFERFCIIINTSTLIFFSTWLVLQKVSKKIFGENTETYLLLLLTILLLLIDLFAVFRIITGVKESCKTENNNSEQGKDKNQKSKKNSTVQKDRDVRKYEKSELQGSLLQNNKNEGENNQLKLLKQKLKNQLHKSKIAIYNK